MYYVYALPTYTRNNVLVLKFLMFLGTLSSLPWLGDVFPVYLCIVYYKAKAAGDGDGD